jgi:hypothetical protein
VVLWGLLRRSLWGAGSGEVIAWHPPGAEQLADAVQLVGGWFLLPASWPLPVHVAAAVFAVGLPTAVAAAPTRFPSLAGGHFNGVSGSGALFGTLVVGGWVYMGTLLVTTALLDANVPLAQRTLAPLQPVLYLLLAALLFTAVGSAQDGPRSRWLAAGIVVGVAVVLAGPASLRIGSSRDEVRSSVVDAEAERAGSAATRLPEGFAVVSNVPGRAWLEAAGPVLSMPRRTDLVTGRPNPDYIDELEELGEWLRMRTGVVVLYPELVLTPGDAVADAVRHAGLERVRTCGSDLDMLAVPEAVSRVDAAVAC